MTRSRQAARARARKLMNYQLRESCVSCALRWWERESLIGRVGGHVNESHDALHSVVEREIQSAAACHRKHRSNQCTREG